MMGKVTKSHGCEGPVDGCHKVLQPDHEQNLEDCCSTYIIDRIMVINMD